LILILDASAAIEIALNMKNAKLLTCDKKLKKIAIEMGVKLIA